MKYYFVSIKIILVLRKVAWADPWAITIITQESAHATLRNTRTILITMYNIFHQIAKAGIVAHDFCKKYFITSVCIHIQRFFNRIWNSTLHKWKLVNTALAWVCWWHCAVPSFHIFMLRMFWMFWWYGSFKFFFLVASTIFVGSSFDFSSESRS